MGKASSAKKVARVARAGGGAGKSSRRGSKPLFPLGIALIVILGVSLIVFARSSNDEASATAPVANVDHWHAAYGVRLCGLGFHGPIQVQDDPVGIHTHGDGIIHIHPFSDVASGKNATLGQFFDSAGVTINDDQIELDDGTKVKEGDDTCGSDDKPGVVQVAVWDNADEARTTDPEIVTENIRDIRFTGDRMAFTIAFQPEGTHIPPPPTIPTLDNLTDVGPNSGTTGTTVFDPSTATAPVPGATGDTTGTTVASTDTTAPATRDTTATP